MTPKPKAPRKPKADRESLDLTKPEDREWLAANLENVDISSVRIIPRGSDQPYQPFTEEDVTITPEDVDRAIRKWDEMMPEDARGLLEAKIVTPPNEEATGPA